MITPSGVKGHCCGRTASAASGRRSSVDVSWPSRSSASLVPFVPRFQESTRRCSLHTQTRTALHACSYTTPGGSKQTRRRCNTAVRDLYNDLTGQNGVSAGAIHDLLIIRRSNYLSDDAFTSGKIREMIEYLCITQAQVHLYLISFDIYLIFDR